MGDSNSWLMPALFGSLIGLITVALSKIWDELKTVRTRVHGHRNAVLTNDAKIIVLTERIEHLDAEVQKLENKNSQ